MRDLTLREIDDLHLYSCNMCGSFRRINETSRHKIDVGINFHEKYYYLCTVCAESVEVFIINGGGQQPFKRFFRVENLEDKEGGLCYNSHGDYTGKIKKDYTFCKAHILEMPFDESVVGYRSVCDKLEDLEEWFTEECLQGLRGHGFVISVHESNDYKRHNGHYLMKHSTSRLLGKMESYGVVK